MNEHNSLDELVALARGEVRPLAAERREAVLAAVLATPLPLALPAVLPFDRAARRRRPVVLGVVLVAAAAAAVAAYWQPWSPHTSSDTTAMLPVPTRDGEPSGWHVEQGSITVNAQVTASNGTVTGGMAWLIGGVVNARNVAELNQMTHMVQSHPSTAGKRAGTAFGVLFGGRPATFFRIRPGDYTVCLAVLPAGLPAELGLKQGMQYFEDHAADLPVTCKAMRVLAQPAEQSIDIQTTLPPLAPQKVPPSVFFDHQTSGDRQISPDYATRVAMSTAGIHGVLILIKVCVDTAGQVSSAMIVKTSGFAAYDALLVSGVQAWAFRPFTVDGAAVPVCSFVPITHRQR